MDLGAIQPLLRDQHVDGWLVYDFRGSNPVLSDLLPGQRKTTRRAVLFIPADGEPLLLCHALDRNQFESAPVPHQTYLSWGEFRDLLAAALAGRTRIAMEYAPGGTLPAIAIVDAGSVELMRSLGVEVVSSANLIQLTVGAWSDAAIEGHLAASRQVAEIKDAAFRFIAERLAGGQSVSEQDTQRFIQSRFAAAGLEAPDPPIVAVNEHSGDPHYSPPEGAACPIRRGDWVLIDLWARRPGRENVFADITWMGFAGDSPSAQQQAVFEAVRNARDAVVQRAQDAWRDKQRIQGWQLDDVARAVLIDAGFGEYIRHRTGHSLSPGDHVHGLGFNLDNFETHDTREMLPRLGFTVEPGLYLPDFGVRLEINMFVDPRRGPIVTSPIQNELIRIT